MPIVALDEAAAILAGGGLVAIPTETVYGLGAHALDPRAIAGIFALKGRPTWHPLILHTVGDVDEHALADDRARALAAAFWPGPLTLVLPRRAHVPDALTGGRPTVAIRSPAHPLARALLARLPLAAPSANRFGGVSPTRAEHVLGEFPGLAVVDGGPCAVGLESTIIDLSRPAAALLRPGGLPIAAIEAVIGPLGSPGDTAAPGTLAAHYAPRARVIPTSDPRIEAIKQRDAGYTVAIIHASEPVGYARRLYDSLRALDGVDVIVVEWAPPGGLGDAINDRLRRAAASGEPHGNS